MAIITKNMDVPPANLTGALMSILDTTLPDFRNPPASTTWFARIPFFLILFMYLYLSGSLLFDAAHYYFHYFSKSRYRWLRCIGHLHMVHHFYFNRRLQFNSQYLVQNILFELPVECLCQLTGNWLGYQLAITIIPLSWIPTQRMAFRTVVVVHIAQTLVVMIMGGRDSNHIEYKTLPKDPNRFWVGPHYHALHHAYPNAYMGSVCRLFDWVAGTANSLQQKHIVMTGANGSFGRAMTKKLLSAGAKEVEALTYATDWTYDDYSRITPALQRADILIIAHGTKSSEHMLQGNYHSVVALIDLFKLHQDVATKFRRSRHHCVPSLPEIWYVGSEAELFHLPLSAADGLCRDSKRAFLPRARDLYGDPSIIYRHIVPAAFSSQMGWAIVSADWVASVAMWWIARGATYVPATYTGLAFVNFVKFRYQVNQSSITKENSRPDVV